MNIPKQINDFETIAHYAIPAQSMTVEGFIFLGYCQGQDKWVASFVCGDRPITSWSQGHYSDNEKQGRADFVHLIDHYSRLPGSQ